MCAGELRGAENGIRGCVVVETGDVFRDRTIEQRHVLRQITDMFSEFVRIPIFQRSTVEAYDSRGRWPNAD